MLCFTHTHPRFGKNTYKQPYFRNQNTYMKEWMREKKEMKERRGVQREKE
jgi:hypothetical protein